MPSKNNMYQFEHKYENLAYICGLDEVGRGCWAGPLVAAACILTKNYHNDNILDSKKLSENRRNILFNEIVKNALDYSIVFIDPKTVDEFNPKKSSIMAMEQAVRNLKIKPDVLLIDAEKLNINIKQESIIKGDDKSISIAAASILAKVARDKYMIEQNSIYPNYKFDKNKGYGTADHIEALNKYGIIERMHRKSYKPIKKILNGEKIKSNTNLFTD
ncbi:MAG: ribonuclease HII [Mycoplasmataceae bacterium]|nr:ribonuclease HII [Mycoplasmataceae bacterium]